jgi:PAS domain S-box-containing protein
LYSKIWLFSNTVGAHPVDSPESASAGLLGSGSGLEDATGKRFVKRVARKDSDLCFCARNADRMSVSSTDSPSLNPLSLSGDSSGQKRGETTTREGHFLLSPDGTIQYADAEAAVILGREGKPLTGRRLLDFLDFAIETEDPDDETIQWNLLVNSALGIRVPVPASRGDTGASLTVYLRFTESEGAYFASITDRPSMADRPAENPAQTQETEGPANERLEALVESSQFGLFDLNFGSKEIYYSPGWKQMLGFADNELPNTQSTWIDLIHPEDSDAAPHQSVRRKPNESRSFSLEFRMRCKDGSYKWLQSRGLQKFDSDGKLDRVIGLHIDYQERKEIEEESIRNEDRFFTFLGNTDRGFFDLDFLEGTAFFSATWRKQLGYSDQDLDLTPKGFLELLPPGDAAGGLDNFFSDPELDRRQLSKRYRLRHKDGHWENFDAHLIRITNRAKDLIRVIGLQLAPKKDSEGLEDGASAPLMAALDTIAEGVIVTDSKSRILYANAKAETLTGTRPGTASGQDLDKVFNCFHRQSQQRAEGLVDQVLTSRESIPLSDQFTLEHPDGSKRPISLACRMINNEGHDLFGVALVFRDPSELTRTPEEIITCNRMEALGNLASGIAHDFNMIMAGILGGISLAKDKKEFEPLEAAEKGCLRARELTRQILSFAKVGNAGQKVQHIDRLIRDCVALATSGSSKQVATYIPNDLHSARVDAAQISQVVQNLVLNALQATEEGDRIEVGAENIVLTDQEILDLPAGEYIRIAVGDSGVGIPAENLDRIFTPFFSTRDDATGLGLAMVKTIIEKHDGGVTVESTEGRGAVFSLYIPATEESSEDKASEGIAVKFGTGRILVMDDDQDICEVATGMLEILGYESEVARNGEEAISMYRKYHNVGRPYDAVILDLTIVGGMGGEEALAKLKEIDENVRAIVSSGYNTDETEADYLAKGFTGVLSKPYRSADLGRVLKGILEKGGSTVSGE